MSEDMQIYETACKVASKNMGRIVQLAEVYLPPSQRIAGGFNKAREYMNSTDCCFITAFRAEQHPGRKPRDKYEEMEENEDEEYKKKNYLKIRDYEKYKRKTPKKEMLHRHRYKTKTKNNRGKERSENENTKRNMELLQDIKSSGFHCIPATGGFIENLGQDNETVVTESVYCVVNNGMSRDKFVKLMVHWCGKYKQDAVLITEPTYDEKKEKAILVTGRYYNSSGSVIDKFTNVKLTDVAQYFTKICGKQFTLIASIRKPTKPIAPVKQGDWDAGTVAGRYISRARYWQENHKRLNLPLCVEARTPEQIEEVAYENALIRQGVKVFNPNE